MAVWTSRSRPTTTSPVVVQFRSILGNPIFEVARYDSGMWRLQDGTFIERPDWIQGWIAIPDIPLEMLNPTSF